MTLLLIALAIVAAGAVLLGVMCAEAPLIEDEDW